MKNQLIRTHRMMLFLLAALAAAVLVSQTLLFAGDNQIEFKGTIKRTDSTSKTAGKLVIALTSPSPGGPEVTVLVDALTRIVGEADITLSFSDLKVGQFLEIRGIFTSTGIAALKIHLEAENEAENEFHIRGTIDTLTVVGDTATLVIGGTTVIANASTRIQRRDGTGGLTLVDLAVGQSVEAEGAIQNGQLVAARIEIGERLMPQAELEFEGTITAINGSVLTVQISKNPPITVPVNITDTTRIEGKLAVGVDIEIKGMMARDFTIVATAIEVAGAEEEIHGHDDGSGNNGNGNGNLPPQNILREIQLTATSSAPAGAEGEAEIEFETEASSVEQKFKVKGNHLTANATFDVQASFGSGFIDVGTFSTDNKGQGELELRCGATCPNFPNGKDVRNIAGVKVLNSGNMVVLQGSF